MGALTASCPKALIRLWGHPLVDYQIAALSAQNVKEIVIVTGYRNNSFDYYSDITKIHNPKWSSTNMFYSLMCANDILERHQCLITYSDIFYPPSALDTISRTSSDIGILYDVNWYELWSSRFSEPLSDAETFQIGEQGKLFDIGQKGTSVKDIQGQYMGVFTTSPAGWSAIKSGIQHLSVEQQENIDMTSTLRNVLKSKAQEIDVFPYSGVWEIDSLSDLELYETWKTKYAHLFGFY